MRTIEQRHGAAKGNEMKDTEFKKLVSAYGEEKANKALRWFIDNHSADFRKSVNQHKFIENNEYLWF